MDIVYRTIHTVGFSVKAHRDAMQQKLLLLADSIVTDLSLKTRCLSGPDISTSADKGYEWFDPTTRDGIWAARLIVGFTDAAENARFQAALISAVGTKDATSAYIADATGKVGAFTVDILPILVSADKSVVEMR